MNKKNIKENKKLSSPIAELYINIIKSAKNDIDFEFERIRMLEQIKEIHLLMEPFKLFITKHNAWKKELNEIDDHIFNIYKEIDMSISDYYSLVEINS